MAARFFRSAAELRRWLETNHAKRPELLVGFYKKDSGRGGLTYPEALDEALCFGWIDGLRKGLDAGSYTIRFTPRGKRSIWSQVNLGHMKRLLAAGRVRPAGRAAYEQRQESRMKRYSFENEPEFTPQEAKRFRADRKAWAFFQSLTPSQRKGFTWWVVSAKKEDTRRRRMDALIATCARGEFDPLRLPKTR